MKESECSGDIYTDKMENIVENYISYLIAVKKEHYDLIKQIKMLSHKWEGKKIVLNREKDINPDIKWMYERIEFQKKKEKRLMQWIVDLLSGKYVNCVYCGHRYGPTDTTPTSMSEILTEHIKHCEHHPLNTAITVIERLLSMNLYSCRVCEYSRNSTPCRHCSDGNQWKLKEEIKCMITQLGISV